MQAAHQQVVVAAVTFCLGIALLQPFLSVCRDWFGGRVPGPAESGPLRLLLGVVAGSTILYLFVRREEGDFRALMLLTVGLFGLSEVVAFAYRVAGSSGFQMVSALFTITSVVYGVLALCAALVERTRKPDPAKPLLALACGAIVLVCLSRSLFGLMDSQVMRMAQEVASLVLMSLTAAYIVVRLIQTRPGTDAGRPGSKAGPSPAVAGKVGGEPSGPASGQRSGRED